MTGAKRWLSLLFLSVVFSFTLSKSLGYGFAALYPNVGIPNIFLFELVALCAALLGALGVSIALQGRHERDQLLSQATTQINEAVVATIKSTLENAPLLNLYVDLTPKLRTTRIFDSFSDLIRQLNARSPELISAADVFLEREFTDLAARVESLFSDGIYMDIADHIRMTRRLCSEVDTYLEIQQRAFNVSEDWTNEWKIFLKEISLNKKMHKRYIVIIPKTDILGEAFKLKSMDKYLSEYDVEFYVCEKERVADALGGNYRQDRVIELFGRRIIKAAELPSGGYRGSIMLKMSVYDAARRHDIVKYIEAVEADCKPLEHYAQPGNMNT